MLGLKLIHASKRGYWHLRMSYGVSILSIFGENWPNFDGTLPGLGPRITKDLVQASVAVHLSGPHGSGQFSVMKIETAFVMEQVPNSLILYEKHMVC